MLQLHTNKVTPGQDTEMENEDEDSAGSVATPVEESSEDENDEESQYERSDDETDDNHLYYIWQNDTQELFTEFIKENQIRQNKTKVTKSYGEIEFDEDRTNSLYIRVHSGTKDELMWKLMTEIWQMDTPKLLISISGELDSKNTTLLKALVETARENHAWIITDGSLALENCGYIYLLGIAKWSILSGKQCLEGTDGTGQWPAKYEGGQIQDSGVKLDENHTHFILVDDDDDDDDDDDGDGDVKYHPSKREKIEVNRPGDLKQIPLVLIVVNGDCSTLHRLLYHASEHTPAIVVEGSGGIADIVARTLQNEGSCDEATIGQIIEEKRGIENKEENDKIKEMVNDIQEYKTNLTSFQLKNDIDSENISSAIDDAIAKEKDFPKLESRLVSNSVEKVEHFLKDGLNLKKFLTPERLVTLYKKSLDSNEKNNARFSTRRILRERYKIFSNSTGSRDNRLTPLRNVMKKLVHDINKDLYKDNKLSDLPETDLFLWALIMNRQRMALCFWKELDNGNIGAALIASRMLTALAETADDIEEHALSKILLQNANDFQDLAIGVLDTCYSTKRQLSEDGLVRKLKQWNNTTCLSIANVSKQMRFVEHECCQVFLQSNWKGKLVINTTFQWIKARQATVLHILTVMSQSFVITRT
ncbi:transient receptor potential cation channel subfamily M member 2-like [Saccoglossus kowalevskii]